MRIIFTINRSNEVRVTFYACIMIALTLPQTTFMNFFSRFHEPVLLTSISNVSNVGSNLYQEKPYDHYRCLPTSTKHCLGRISLKIARILPLILFVVQIHFVRELFSVNGGLKSVFVSVLWIISLISFCHISIIAYRKPEHYTDVTENLCYASFIIFIIVSRMVISLE